MGPELLAAIIGPLLGGVVSAVLWVGSRNAKAIDNGFAKIHGTIEKVYERIDDVDLKVDTLREDVAKNYVSNSRFEDHIDLQSSMSAKVAEEMKGMRTEAKERSEEFKKHTFTLSNDIGEIKEMQWKTRLGVLDLIDRKLGRKHSRDYENPSNPWVEDEDKE